MNFKDLCEARYSCRAFEKREIEQEKQDYIKKVIKFFLYKYTNVQLYLCNTNNINNILVYVSRET